MTDSPSNLETHLVSNKTTPTSKAADSTCNKKSANHTIPTRRVVEKGYIEGGEVPDYPMPDKPSVPMELVDPPPGMSEEDLMKIENDWLDECFAEKPISKEMQEAQDKWWEYMGGKGACGFLDEDEIWEAEKILQGIRD